MGGGGEKCAFGWQGWNEEWELYHLSHNFFNGKQEEKNSISVSVGQYSQCLKQNAQ